ncbi:hypothetical protein JYU34_010660 [Plutella xylostella]|uniref:Hemicentin/VWA7 galactose-binding domain-containing protein n=1 Tax=Plutella xylostella TaxID=51655 RepID=A0ABQ7QK38_PLUXY|nr:hypothetical protein JYU34_010660 [Plutella xylostella]
MAARDRIYSDFATYVAETGKLDELKTLSADLDSDIEDSRNFMKQIQKMYAEASIIQTPRDAEPSNTNSDLAQHDEITKFLECGPPRLLLPDMSHLYDCEVDIDQTLSQLKSVLDSLPKIDRKPEVFNLKPGLSDLDFSSDLEQHASSLDLVNKRLTYLKNIKNTGRDERNMELEAKFEHLCQDVDLFTKIVFILTGHCEDLARPHYRVYQQLAAASFGQVFHLNKSNVHDVLDFVRSSIGARAVNLGSAVYPPGDNYTRSFPVDSSLVEVTVSVAGAAPHIHVTSPSGTPLEPPRLLTPLSLDEVKIVKLIEPEAGTWSLSVGSRSRHSLRVGGRSALAFAPAFSASPPGGYQGNRRPLLGTLNYMTITLSETNSTITLSHAELLDLEGKPLFELPLRLVDGDKRIYATDAFMPPEDLFFIAVSKKYQRKVFN